MTERGTATTQRSWIILRKTSSIQVFDGITAESKEEAIQKYLEGDGDLNLERSHTSEWDLDAEPVDG